MQGQPLEAKAPGPIGHVGGDLGRTVHAQGVQDQMDDLVRRRLLIEQAQQLNELSGAVPLAHQALHLARLHGTGRQHRRRAVTHVRTRTARGPPRRDRFRGRGGFTHPDAGLLIHTEGGAIGGRVQFQPNDLTALATKSGSRSSIQESQTVQAQVMRREDAAKGAFTGRAQP